MTHEEIDSLSGDALNQAVAEALGSTPYRGPIGGGGRGNWSPATKIEDAWALLDGLSVQITLSETLIEIRELGPLIVEGPRSDAPALICRFFLKGRPA